MHQIKRSVGDRVASVGSCPSGTGRPQNPVGIGTGKKTGAAQGGKPFLRQNKSTKKGPKTVPEIVDRGSKRDKKRIKIV